MLKTVATSGILRTAGAIVLATTGLFSSGVPATSAAAAVTGYAAVVICDIDASTISMTPSATGIHNGVPQTIYYRYWILNRNTGQYVRGYNPTTYGSFVFNSGYRQYDPFSQSWTTVTHPAASGSQFTVRLPHGRYSVFTEYWGGGNGVWTTSYRYYLGGWDSGSCRV